MMMNMTYEDAQYLMAASETLAERFVKAVKNYWEEYGDVICAGLSAMNGQPYVPANRR